MDLLCVGGRGRKCENQDWRWRHIKPVDLNVRLKVAPNCLLTVPHSETKSFGAVPTFYIKIRPEMLGDPKRHN